MRASLGPRVRLALAFGTAAAVLCIALAFALSSLTRELAQAGTARYLSRLAIELAQRLQEADSAAGVERLRVQIESTADPAFPAELLLLTRSGIVMAGPRHLVGMQIDLGAAPLPAVRRWPDGERYLVAHSPAPGGAQVLARTPAKLALGWTRGVQDLALWAGLALALCGAAGGWLLATRHVGPLESLTGVAQQIARGDGRVQFPHLHDDAELIRLGEALRAMLAQLRAQNEALRQSRDELERRVHERTAELVRAQAKLQLELVRARLDREEVQ